MTGDLVDRLVAAVRDHYAKNDTPLLLSRFGLAHPELLAELKKQYGKLKAAIMAAGEDRLGIVQSEGREAVVLRDGATEIEQGGQEPPAEQNQRKRGQMNEAASAWLLTWNPKKWDHDKLQQFRDDVIGANPVERCWSCVTHRPGRCPKEGDHAYLMRLGDEPKGIIAYGTIMGPPVEKDHWQRERAQRGEKYWCVPVRFSGVRDPDHDAIVPLDDLNRRGLEQRWDPVGSGIKLNGRAAEELARLWRELPEVKARNKARPTIVTEVDMASPNRPPLNLILYGPPGTGKTHKLLTEFLPSYKDRTPGPARPPRYEFVTFHQSYAYEDFVEGIRPETKAGAVTYHVKPGVFQLLCQRARKDPSRHYAIFIDEINRANVAKVFGELITLLEPDKRVIYNPDGTLKSGLEVTLPYSGEPFSVPANVDVYGTMNTADRSIALFDLALRRRFEFEELVPNSDILPGSDDNGRIPDGDGGWINLRLLLAALNKRITHLLDRDHAIGHAYLWKVKNFEMLQRVLWVEIIPLLQEYFYEDWRRICLALGVHQNLATKDKLIRVETASKLFPDVSDDRREASYYVVTPQKEITAAAVRNIYESVRNEG